MTDKMAIIFFLNNKNLSLLNHNEHNQVKVNEHNARLFLSSMT